MDLSKREKVLISILLIIGVFGLYTSYLFLPKWQDLLSHRQILGQKELILKDLQYQDKNALNNKKIELATSYEEIHGEVPSSMKLSDLYTEFISLQENSKVDFETLEFSSSNEVEEDLLYEINIQIVLRGEEENVEDFFNSLYEMERKLIITEINHSSLEDSLIRASYTVHAYSTNP